MAQVTEKPFDSDRSIIIKNCNRIVEHVSMHQLEGIVSKPDIGSLLIVGFSDKSFECYSDLTSHISVLYVLSDNSEAVFRSFQVIPGT